MPQRDTDYSKHDTLRGFGENLDLVRSVPESLVHRIYEIELNIAYRQHQRTRDGKEETHG